MDYFVLGGVVYGFLYNKFFAGASGDGNMTWPAMIFDYANETYTLKSDLGDNAVYQNSAGNELYVSTSDVDGNCIHTIYGEFHW